MQEGWLQSVLHEQCKKLKIAAVVAVIGTLFSLVCVEILLSGFLSSRLFVLYLSSCLK